MTELSIRSSVESSVCGVARSALRSCTAQIPYVSQMVRALPAITRSCFVGGKKYTVGGVVIQLKHGTA